MAEPLTSNARSMCEMGAADVEQAAPSRRTTGKSTIAAVAIAVIRLYIVAFHMPVVKGKRRMQHIVRQFFMKL